MNTLLADEYVLYTKTKFYHWNIVSPNFYELLKFFDDQAEQLEDLIDQIAERIRTLGQYAVGSIKEFNELTRLLEKNGETGRAINIMQNLLHDHETIIRIVRKDLILVADSDKDAGTVDFLTGLMVRHGKMAWMLRAHIVKQ